MTVYIFLPSEFSGNESIIDASRNSFAPDLTISYRKRQHFAANQLGKSALTFVRKRRKWDDAPRDPILNRVDKLSSFVKEESLLEEEDEEEEERAG